MTRIVKYYSICILISFLASSVNCQKDTDIYPSSIWGKVKAAVRRFVGDMRDVWGDFQYEVKARTRDMSDLTQEMWSTFKEKMDKWMQKRHVTKSEQEAMNRYLDKFRMPEEESKR